MANLGWECPKCHRCYAPVVQECVKCAPQRVQSDEINSLEKELRRQGSPPFQYPPYYPWVPGSGITFC